MHEKALTKYLRPFVDGRRLSYKDYVDWYFLLKEKHVGLAGVISLCQKKFGNDFNDRLFLGQLVSMEDIPNQKIDFLQKIIDRPTMQRFFRETVRTYKF